MQEPLLFPVTVHTDERGSLSYANDFTFPNVKRFYHIFMPKKNTIRAFHGHMREEKFAYILKGSIKIILAPLSNKNNPSKNVALKHFLLDSKEPAILYIPAGYANGIMSVKDDSEIIFYSTLLVEDSLQDDYRFDPYYWGKDTWEK